MTDRENKLRREWVRNRMRALKEELKELKKELLWLITNK